MKQLKNLRIIGLDFSEACYAHVDATLTGLNDVGYTGKVFIHFDQTGTSHTCGQPKTDDQLTQMDKDKDGTETAKVMSECYKTLTTTLSPANLSLVKGVMWEQEANKFVNLCASEDWCADYWKKQHGLEFAGWRTNFDFVSALPEFVKNWNYVFYEYYNIYTKKCDKNKTTNPDCQVDYNPPDDKCFKNAQTGPVVAGQPQGHADCGKGAGTVYCGNLTPAERGAWMAQILLNRGIPTGNIRTPERKSYTLRLLPVVTLLSIRQSRLLHSLMSS